jgi:flagellar biosynthesis protein
VVFHAAAGLNEVAITAVQAQVRRRVLRTFVRLGLIGKCDAEEMAGWDHGGGFSVDAAVRIEGNDRAGLERLLRYCARHGGRAAHGLQCGPGRNAGRKAVKERSLAVALKYAPGDAAPQVVAKGRGLVAQEIIARAKEHGVFVHESPELVTLLSQVDLDDHIPPALYIAVAELLAWLYRMEQGDGNTAQETRRAAPSVSSPLRGETSGASFSG